MAKPIIAQIIPFDANHNHAINFSWSGSRSYGNRCVISYIDTLAEVYNQVSNPNFLLSHTIPAGTLTNGSKYVIQISTFDADGNESPLSDKEYFYCVETPRYGFVGLTTTGRTEIDNASYTATIDYSQPDWEDVRSYRFHLYDAGKTLLLTSDEMYDQANITYTYRGLETSSTYYLRWTGVTINGIELDTGYVEIFVKYQNPSTYASIYAENVPLRGYIKYNTNIKIVQYNGDTDFTFDYGKINLLDDVLYYDEGFTIPDNFTLKIKGVDMWKNAEVFKAQNVDGQSFYITSYIYEDDIRPTLRFKLTVPNVLCNYIIYSEPMVFEPEDMVIIVVRRINNVWGIYTYLSIGELEEEEVATYFSDTRPIDGVVTGDYWIENGEAEILRIAFEDRVIITQENEPVNPPLNAIWIAGGELTDKYILYVRNGVGSYGSSTLSLTDTNSSIIEETMNLVCTDDTYETERWIKEV